jgi:NADH-quinone oxidoreductase subunit M
MNLLLLVLLLPLAGFFAALVVQRDMARRFALGLSTAIFLLSLGLIGEVMKNPNGPNLEVDMPWMTTPNIHFHLALDGLSLWLVILSTLLTPLCVLISWNYIKERSPLFYAFLLLLEFGVIGVFAAQDLFLFYTFWEITLVPMYFLIGIWGHERRIYATVKFFLYTMAGSVLMLAAIIYLYGKTNTFDYPAILAMLASGEVKLSAVEQLPLFLAFFIAFAIKVPLFPLHTWLPDAHVEAPTAGSVMLASVMLKMGTYGIVRFCLPLFGDAAARCAPFIVTLAIIGIVYGALVALVQPNMKKLVAYSSVSHLGFVILGIFVFNQQGMDGAVYQMLNHGVSTGALFMIVGMLYERCHTLEISEYGGVVNVAPKLTIAFFITTLASIGLPMLNNFVGEFLVLQGAVLANPWWAAFAALGVIFSACYMLWMFQRVFLGRATHDVEHHITSDMTFREMVAVAPLIVLMFWMGIGTTTFLAPVSTASAKILEQSKVNRQYQANTQPAAPTLAAGASGLASPGGARGR